VYTKCDDAEEYDGVKIIAVIITCLQYLSVCDKPKRMSCEAPVMKAAGQFLIFLPFVVKTVIFNNVVGNLP